MKKMLLIFTIGLLAMPLLAADLKLEVDAASNGRVDAKTIDVTSVAAGDEITLCVVLDNLDFTLAGMELTVTFPAFLTLLDVSAVNTVDAPYQLDTTATGLDTVNVQDLPADSAGDSTATTFFNSTGFARIGWVITEAADRPSSGSRIIAKLKFLMGRDYDLTPSARTDANCISSAEVIRVINTALGGTEDPIFADETAANVSVSGSGAALEVALTNANATYKKGDTNQNGSVSTLDVSRLVQCVVVGVPSSECPWPADNAAYKQANDMNCSGSVEVLDITGVIEKATGVINTSAKTFTSDYYALGSDKGELNIDSTGTTAAIASVEFAIKGRVAFDANSLLSEAAKNAGWIGHGRYIHESGVFKYILVNMRGENAQLPAVNLNYKVLSDKAEIAIRSAESYLYDDTVVPYQPSVEDVAFVGNLKPAPGDRVIKN